jgi:hypothetical protein
MHCLGRTFNKVRPFQRLTTSYDARAIRLSTFDIVGAQGQSSAPHINVELEMKGVAIYRKAAIEYLLPSLWASMSMQYLESLQVIHGYHSVDVWQHIFDGLTGSQLKHLEVIGNGSGIARLYALSTFLLPQAGTSEGQSRVPLPSLRELAIKRWDFRERVDDGPFFERFKTCLEDRKKHHEAIDKLSLVECNRVTVEHVAKLRKVASHVTWDRPSDNTSDDDHFSEVEAEYGDDSEFGVQPRQDYESDEGWGSEGNYNWRDDDGDQDSLNYSYY